MQFSALIIVIAAVFNSVDCSKILLVFPFPSPSHYILGSSLARGLAEAGHDITMVSPFHEANPPRNSVYKDVVLTGFVEEYKSVSANMFRLENISPFIGIGVISYIGYEATRKTFEHPNFQKLINSNEQFDAVIIEMFYSDALNGLGHHFKAPLILFSTVGANSMVNQLSGNPSPLSYIPEIALKYTATMTFWQRVVNFLFAIVSKSIRNLVVLPAHNRLMMKHLPNIPDLSTINNNFSIILLNSHESTSQPVPYVPSMINIGGYHIKPPKELPKDLKEFMDNATEGVVYFSMGSNIKPSDMPDDKRYAILNALGKIKQKVLWKWDEDTLPGKPENVKLSKWFPQQDILGHPNTKLFITHGGLLSTTETIYHGVPILSFPIFCDQKANAARAQINGFGFTLPFSEITEEKLSDILAKLLNDKRYQDNAKRRSKLMHDRPVKPLDLATYWIEYVTRHKGAAHLRWSSMTVSLMLRRVWGCEDQDSGLFVPEQNLNNLSG
ncbi:hypothetical protein NQ315_011117 [Exocentrus adspersus]|uniref:UDP-glucuronosyltransferase n=1 Tax=Exocentrus adspersus TaxID=1586481 RepID=A0AAV8VY34_9CUCU|nr:hypothetical protein NQ315_011117 [Exocentrus adspersus]